MARTLLLLATLSLGMVAGPALAGHPAGSPGSTGDPAGTGPGFGYVGLDPEGTVDAHDLRTFSARVTAEAYSKAEADEVRLALLALLLGAVALSHSRRSRLGARLRAAVDWHALGTLSGMVLFGLVMGSGMVVAFAYNPSPWQAYASVEAMAGSSVLGFFRNLHNWSAEALLALLLLHAARTVSAGACLGKRKVVWVTGALLLAVTWTTFVAGSFLRADQEAVEGFQHIMYALSQLPLGGWVARLFSGELALTRLLVAHVSLAALVTVWLAAPHVLMRREYVHIQRSWRRALAYGGALLGLLVVQSLLMEAPLVRGLGAGPTVAGVELTKPPWPIYFIVAWENAFGADTMMLPPLALLGMLLTLPYAVDALPGPGTRKVRLGELGFYAGALGVLAASYWAAAGPIVVHIF